MSDICERLRCPIIGPDAGHTATISVEDLLEAARDIESLREQLAAKDKRIAELEQWKREGIEVESRWDIQEVARELEVPPGYNIRPEILPRIKQLKEQLAAMIERAERARTLLAEAFRVYPSGVSPECDDLDARIDDYLAETRPIPPDEERKS